MYGSLAWGGFSPGSDIDLFIEGVRGNFRDMYLAAERMGAPFEIRLVLAWYICESA
ncbi:MAG: nucleotidyltransferase domain-containing protein [Bacillota bacterium]